MERTPGFSHLHMHKKLPTNLRNCVILVFFCVMAAFSDSDNEFPSVLAYAYSTQLKDILTGSHEEMTMW